MKAYDLSVLACAAAMLGACGTELGEQVITVDMVYDSGSNWGPEDATGTAVIDTVTGQVDIDVAGLPMLADDRYEGWLAGGVESAVSTGVFNTDESGVGSSTIILGDLTGNTYERVVLTVEPYPDDDPGPDSRHSIGADIQ